MSTPSDDTTPTDKCPRQKVYGLDSSCNIQLFSSRNGCECEQMQGGSRMSLLLVSILCHCTSDQPQLITSSTGNITFDHHISHTFNHCHTHWLVESRRTTRDTLHQTTLFPVTSVNQLLHCHFPSIHVIIHLH